MKRFSKTIVTLFVMVMVMVLSSGKAEANKYPTSKQMQFSIARDNGEKLVLR